MALSMKKENLEQYPAIDMQYLETAPIENTVHQLMIGDLHGSALKSLYFLIKCYLIKFDITDFEAFITIYKKLHLLSDLSLIIKQTDDQLDDQCDAQLNQDLIQLDKILKSMALHSTAQEQIELLYGGDDLGDRAGIDLASLIQYHVLDQLNLMFRIMHSNHTSVLLLAAAKDFQLKLYGLPFQTLITMSEDPSSIYFGQDRSLQNLGILLKKNLVDRQQLKSLITTYCLHYRALDYSLSQDGKRFTLESHAAVDLSITWHMVSYLLTVELTPSEFTQLTKLKPLLDEVKNLFEYCKKKPQNTLQVDNLNLALAYTINTINSIFQRIVADNNIEQLLPLFPPTGPDCTSNPFQFVAWNRNTADLFRPDQFAGCEMYYVHGHDPASPSSEHIINLDKNNTIGRTNNSHTLLHEGNFPHYFLPNQLSQKQINTCLANFDVDQFIQKIRIILMVEEETDDTDEVPSASDSDEENMSILNPLKRAHDTNITEQPIKRKKLDFPNPQGMWKEPQDTSDFSSSDIEMSFCSNDASANAKTENSLGKH